MSENIEVSGMAAAYLEFAIPIFITLLGSIAVWVLQKMGLSKAAAEETVRTIQEVARQKEINAQLDDIMERAFDAVLGMADLDENGQIRFSDLTDHWFIERADAVANYVRNGNPDLLRKIGAGDLTRRAQSFLKNKIRAMAGRSPVPLAGNPPAAVQVPAAA